MLFVMLLPIIISVIVLIYALKKGFDKTALVISAGVAMVCAMFIQKYNDSWYAFIFSLTVPFAVMYTLICMYLSIKEDKNGKSQK